MTPELIHVESVAARPWRNGGGVTRELLAWPSAREWRVRISVADIDRDGPFSTFAGVQRWFAVLQGSGVALTVDGVEHRCTSDGDALAFAGDATTACHLIDGPTRDLNLMLRGADGAMLRVTGGQAWRPGSRHCALFARVAGRCHYNGNALDVPAQALLWFERAPDALTFGSARASGSGSEALADPAGWWLAADVANEAVP